MAITLGTLVTDSITGFSGVAVSRTEYLFGCVRVGVQPQQLKEGKMIEAEYIDEQRLDGTSTLNTGGDGRVPPERDKPR